MEKLKASTSGIQIYLHPLVILNVSDNWTRLKVNGDLNKNSRVFGLLLGVQTGRKVDLRTSFGFLLNHDGSFDEQFVKDRVNQMKEIYPKYEILGWYGTGQKMDSDDQLHMRIVQLGFNDSPLFMVLETAETKNLRELPVHFFEPNLVVDDGNEKVAWSTVPYMIETTLAEQISTNAVSHIRSDTTKVSQMVPQYDTLHNAVKMLEERIQQLIQYINAVKNQKITGDHQLLRNINGIVNHLPVIDTAKFNEDFQNEKTEVELITALSAMTKGTHTLNNLIDHWKELRQTKSRGAT